MKKAAIYARVSTADQHVESQLYDLRQLAEERGLEVVKEYADRGVSGTKARRPGLDALMLDARQRKFSVVLVVRPRGEEHQALPARDGRIGQLGNPVRVAPREH